MSHHYIQHLKIYKWIQNVKLNILMFNATVVIDGEIKGATVVIIKEQRLLFYLCFLSFLLFLRRFQFNHSIGVFRRFTYTIYNEKSRNKQTCTGFSHGLFTVRKLCYVKRFGVRMLRLNLILTCFKQSKHHALYEQLFHR